MQSLTKEHRKAGLALIDSNRVRGKFYINCAYFNKPGYKSVRLLSHAYTNKDDAEGDLSLFQYYR